MNSINKDKRLGSILNFRDISNFVPDGGLRKGLIYRSASPDKISRRDLEKFRALGIKTVIDLRGPSEKDVKIREHEGIRRISLPLDFDGKTREVLYPLFYQKGSEEEINRVSQSLYMEITDTAGPALARVAEEIISMDGAMLIHCRAGKDRTGIIAALLHLLAGTEKELIIQDYLRSNDELLPYFKRIMIARKILSLGFFPYRRVIFAIRVKRENIEAVMSMIDSKWNGVEGYLAASGFDINKLSDLKMRLLYNGKS